MLTRKQLLELVAELADVPITDEELDTFELAISFRFGVPYDDVPTVVIAEAYLGDDLQLQEVYYAAGVDDNLELRPWRREKLRTLLRILKTTLWQKA